MKILIPLAGLIDKEAEKERLNKEIDKLIKLQTQFSTKLNNEKFISQIIIDSTLKFTDYYKGLLIKNQKQFLKCVLDPVPCSNYL